MAYYTGKGDKGYTCLPGQDGVSKSSLRVMALGELDELTSSLGVAHAFSETERNRALLGKLLQLLFRMQAEIARPETRAEGKVKVITAEDTAFLEKQTDMLAAEMPALHSFIVPSGTKEEAMLMLARAVCRRCERSIVALAEQDKVDEHLLKFINRLSSLLFAMARYADFKAGVGEEKPDYRK